MSGKVMDALKKVTANSGANTKNHIGNTKIDLGKFPNASEVKAYGDKLKTLKDLKIDGNLIMSILSKLGINIEALLAQFAWLMELIALFTSGELFAFLSSLFDIVMDFLGLSGMSLWARANLDKFLSGVCDSMNNTLNDEYGVRFPGMAMFGTLAVLMSLLCMGNSEAYGTLEVHFATNLPNGTYSKIGSKLMWSSVGSEPFMTIRNIAFTESGRNMHRYVKEPTKGALNYLSTNTINTTNPTKRLTDLDDDLNKLSGNRWNGSNVNVNSFNKNKIYNEMSKDSLKGKNSTFDPDSTSVTHDPLTPNQIAAILV